MKTAFGLLVAVLLAAAPAFAAKKSESLVRGFDSGTFTDEYFGIRYAVDGLEAVEPERKSAELLFRGRTADGLEIEISVVEDSQGAAKVDWLAGAKAAWDRVMPNRTGVEEGRSPRGWTIFVNPDSESGSRQEGWAFYTSGIFVFTVHAWIPARTDTSAEAIRRVLDGLEVEDAPDAFMLAHMITLGSEEEPRSPHVTAKAASYYLRDGSRQDFELAYRAADAARRLGEDTLASNELWQVNYLLGHAQLKTGRIEDAAKTWKRCIKLAKSNEDPKISGSISHYNLAATYALLGRVKRAFRELDEALEMESEAGVTTLRETALVDTDLASLRGDARWKERFGAPR